MPEQFLRQIAARPALPVSPVTDTGKIASPANDRTDNENIEDIVSRLERRYARVQISRAELTNRVRTSYGGFAAARIRSFVSIFVERQVRRSVETPTSKP